MATFLQAESTLTDRYQTTVPEPIRLALQLRKRDKIHYMVTDGCVVITRSVPTEEADPVMGQFLSFLARDIASHPERVQTVDTGLLQRLRSLTQGVEVDLDDALLPEDE